MIIPSESALTDSNWSWAVFNRVSKVISGLLWFCFTRLYDWLAKFAPFSQPMGSQTKTNRIWSQAFSRAWLELHVLASSSDWLIVLFTSVVIGQRNYLVTQLKTALWKSGFQLSVVKPKPKLFLWPITTDVNRSTNRSELEVNIYLTGAKRGKMPATKTQ